MTSTIMLTGGTGTLGKALTPLLRDAGHTLRVLSRNERADADGIEFVTGDLLGGSGLDRSIEGAETLVHLAGGQKGDDVATRNLVAAAKSAGVKHIVYISVIGADRLPLAWFRMKHAAEQAVAESGIPYTILRAAQFHDLVLTVAQKMAKMPVVPAPGGLRFQPVDARDVAARLAELAQGEPAGLVPDLAGPTVYAMGELVGTYLRAVGKRRATIRVRMPGKVGRAYRAGENLTLEGGQVGTRTWEAFLAERVG